MTNLENAGRFLADADIDLAAGAVLDLNATTQTVRSVTGLGSVSNGFLAADAVLSPAGDGTVGTLTLASVQFAPGVQYHADLGDLLDVTGSLDVTGMIVRINNPESLVRSQIYTLIQTSEGITGDVTLDAPLPSGWKVFRKGNALILLSEGGTVLFLK